MGRLSSSKGVNSWLSLEKYFTSLSADWLADKFLSIWLSKLNVQEMSSPGLADISAFLFHPVPFFASLPDGFL